MNNKKQKPIGEAALERILQQLNGNSPPPPKKSTPPKTAKKGHPMAAALLDSFDAPPNPTKAPIPPKNTHVSPRAQNAVLLVARELLAHQEARRLESLIEKKREGEKAKIAALQHRESTLQRLKTYGEKRSKTAPNHARTHPTKTKPKAPEPKRTHTRSPSLSL